jgi:hypothetical protein
MTYIPSFMLSGKPGLVQFGLQIPFRDNLAIGAIFVMISLLRSYALRRLFERLR